MGGGQYLRLPARTVAEGEPLFFYQNTPVLKLNKQYMDPYKYRYVKEEYRGQLFCRPVPRKQRNYKQVPGNLCISHPPDFIADLPSFPDPPKLHRQKTLRRVEVDTHPNR